MTDDRLDYMRLNANFSHAGYGSAARARLAATGPLSEANPDKCVATASRSRDCHQASASIHQRLADIDRCRSPDPAAPFMCPGSRRRARHEHGSAVYGLAKASRIEQHIALQTGPANAGMVCSIRKVD